MDGVEVSSNVREVKRATEKSMLKAARMIGGSIEGHAKELCPVDTGLLRNSITFAIGGQMPNTVDYASNDKDKSGNQIPVTKGTYPTAAPADSSGEVTVYVGTNVEYAPYQELGTVKMKAKPFLRPAFENNQGEIEQILEKCMKEIP